MFQFTCLVFGFGTGPYICTKLLKPVVRILRLRNFSSVIYLDDWFFVEESFEICQESVKVSVELLESLGFLINFKKSNLISSLKQKFLGCIIDSQRMTIALSVERKMNVERLVEKCLKSKECSIKEFSSLIGTLVSPCQGLDYGWLYIKTLEREKILALRRNGMEFRRKMDIPSLILPDLRWWKDGE